MGADETGRREEVTLKGNTVDTSAPLADPYGRPSGRRQKSCPGLWGLEVPFSACQSTSDTGPEYRTSGYRHTHRIANIMSMYMYMYMYNNYHVGSTAYQTLPATLHSTTN